MALWLNLRETWTPERWGGFHDALGAFDISFAFNMFQGKRKAALKRDTP